MITHIKSEAEFDQIIKSGSVLVDFYATWCGPCRMLTEVLEDVSREKSDLVIVKVDVDELGSIAARYHVQAIPFLLFYKDGELVNQAMGYKNKNELLDFISK